MASACHAQAGAVVCRDGSGSFEAAFLTHVTVQVGAARRDGLATRVCEGTLLWDKKKLVIAPSAAQVDVDALGIDLGLGAPVVTFQVKGADTECCMRFQIYSLQKPPKLLRTVSGGSFFSTADTDLDGQIEIWTDDAASLVGFESLNIRGPDLAPAVILRFVHGRLLDVSSEFQSYFDTEIARVRSELDPQDLRDFKNSTGRLPPTAYFSPEDLHRSESLGRTKLRVLQIVWSYLYSGREQDAWSSLGDMWPAADFDRIRAAISSARAQGIRAQVDGVSPGIPSGAKEHTEVFDVRTWSAPAPGIRWSGRVAEDNRLAVVPPKPILIERRAPKGQSGEWLAGSELLLDLVIDSAGKVRSAESAEPSFDIFLKSETPRWKFIPAFRAGRAVASRVYFVVSPKQ